MAAPVTNNFQFISGVNDFTGPWELENYVVASGPNKRLIVVVFAEAGGDPTHTITGVTYGSDVLSLRVSEYQIGDFQTAQIWEVIDPTEQTATISVATSGTCSLGRWILSAFYLTNASQVDAVEDSDSSGDASATGPTSLSLTTTSDDCLIIGAHQNSNKTVDSVMVKSTGYTELLNEQDYGSTSMSNLIEYIDAGTAGAKTVDPSTVGSNSGRHVTTAIAIPPGTWTSGHTHEATMSVPATTDGALTDYTLLLTEADFNAADRGALADAFNADEVECSTASDGSAQLAIDVLDVDTGADTFTLRVGPVDTSDSVALDLYWRYGSSSITQTGSDAYNSDLYGYYPLDTDVNNRTGIGPNGTLVGTPDQQSGKVNGAYHFNPADSEGVDIEDGLVGFEASGKLTISAWVNTDAIVSATSVIVAAERTGGLGGRSFFLWVDNNTGLLRFFAVDATGLATSFDLTTSTTDVRGAGWKHVVARYDDSVGAEVFVDAVSEGTAPSTAGINEFSPTPLSIGYAKRGPDDYFHGVIDEVMISIDAWSDAWVATEFDRSNTLGQATTPAFSVIPTILTVDTDNLSGDYASLSAALAAIPGTLDRDYFIECAASTGVADTTNVTVNFTNNGFTLTIRAASGHEAGKTWNASKYRRVITSTGTSSIDAVSDVTIEGLQIDGDSLATTDCISSSGADLTVVGCLLRDANRGVFLGGGTESVLANTVILGCTQGFYNSAGGAGYAFYCTVLNCGEGIRVASFRSIDIKNCYIGGSSTSDITEESSGVINLQTVYTSDGSGGTGSTPIVAMATGSGAYFANVTPGSEDVTIGALSELIGNGTDLAADVTYPVTTDIDGETRTTFDVGADEYPTPVNAAPVLASIEGTALAFEEGDAATAVTSSITVSDSDSANLTSATIEITSGYVNGEDVLAFAPNNGITGTFTAGTGVLALTGSSLVANYELALRAVTFNTSDPVTAGTRTLSFTVNDGTDDSNTVTRDIAVSVPNAVPVLANIEGSARYFGDGDGPLNITDTITITDADDTDLVSATVVITSGYINGQDILAFANTANITGSWVGDTITLTGTASIAEYQAALRAVTYDTDDPVTTGVRTFSITVNDGNDNSNTVTRDFDVGGTPVDSTAPAFSSAVAAVSGSYVDVTLIETESAPLLPASLITGFTLTASGGAVTVLTAIRTSSTVIRLCLSRILTVGETVTLSYSGGNVTDSAASPNALADLTDETVTNNSTAGASGGGGGGVLLGSSGLPGTRYY